MKIIRTQKSSLISQFSVVVGKPGGWSLLVTEESSQTGELTKKKSKLESMIYSKCRTRLLLHKNSPPLISQQDKRSGRAEKRLAFSCRGVC
jgi:hypothetical protein